MQTADVCYRRSLFFIIVYNSSTGKLMNSAMMPSPYFCYRPRLITREECICILREAHQRGKLESYIGYPATADHIAKISSVIVAVSRSETRVQAGDVLLVCRLRYRADNPAQKASAAAQAAISDETSTTGGTKSSCRK